MMRLGLVALIAATMGCSAATTTIVVVRHAEKGSGKDPDLTPEGQKRAQALVDVLRRSGVAAAYHTAFKRTMQTGEPLAAELGIPLIQVDYIPGQETAHAEALKRKILADYPGKAVLVVGHTTTLPVILQALGIPDAAPIPETDYDNLFVVIWDGTRGRLVKASFRP